MPLLTAVRIGLAGAGLVLAVASRGDAVVLAVVLVALAGHPLALPAVGAALVASSWRWGASSLEALSGAQAVLGPAGGVGPAAAAVGSWLAGVAILLAVGRATEEPGRIGWVDGARAAATGAAVAAVLAGPAPGGDLAVRVVVGVGVTAAAVGLGVVRARHHRLDLLVDVLAVLAGLGAVVAVAPDAPSWPPTIELGDVAEGVALALAAVGLVLVGLRVAALASPRPDAAPPSPGPRLDPASGAPGHRSR